MTITQKTEANAIVLECEGRLDTTTAPELEAVLLPVFDTNPTVILDFKYLEYVSSAGLRVLLKGQKKAVAVGGSMTVRNVMDEIIEVFEMTGFIDVLTVERI
ncbi:MAG: STAS domain-containing protein [Oscillospiraceae bacterium]|jgi:anti-anti-sigma factor|nr:STAS domain-containing protein [Oscillospiraceae bacterium]